MVLIQFADLAPRAANLSASTLHHSLIGGVFPQNEVFDYLEESFPLFSGLLLIFTVFKPSTLLETGVIDELSKDYGVLPLVVFPTTKDVACWDARDG